MSFQLKLSTTQAEVQAKNMVIKAQEKMIKMQEQHNLQLEGYLQIEKQKSKENEDVIPGFVSVTKQKWKGIEINWPEIWRRLKRKWEE